MKNLIIGTIGVFVAWMALDFVFHGIVLADMYQKTASLWRPENEMKMGLNVLVVLITAAIFTAIYVFLIRNKGIKTGLIYGLLYGIAVGVGAGFGSYSFMPLPFSLALSWFGIIVLESVIGGAVLGAIASRDH